MTTDFCTISGITNQLFSSYKKDCDMWKDSPFKWIKEQSSRTIGAIGETVVEKWLTSNGCCVKRSPDSEADRIVDGKRVEIKFSTLWSGGFYKFQQIRDQNYDFIVLFGVSPFDCHCWVVKKDEIIRMRNEGIIEGQHTGSGGKDTSWIQLYPNNENENFRMYGNSLDVAYSLIRKYCA
jgi:hypothetical protein